MSFIYKCPTRGWIFNSLTIGVIPFERNHTAANTLELIEQETSKFGLAMTDFSSCTQDNASSAFNVFDPVDHVAQLPCSAHTMQLFLLHTMEGVGRILEAFDSIHAVLRYLSQFLQADRTRRSLKNARFVTIGLNLELEFPTVLEEDGDSEDEDGFEEEF